MEDRYLWRGKDSSGNWHTGYLYQDDYDTRRESYIIENIDNILLAYDGNIIQSEVITETIGQCTGRLAKEDKQIYENDLLGVTRDGINLILMVQYNIGKFVAVVVNNNKVRQIYDLWEVSSDSTIIGNIHDNLELLGAK